jgi:1-acyl-sn-glycerol-3-phosphate acyltransferase
VLLRALDLRVRAEGTALVPRTGPALLVSNHVSFPDFVWIAAALQGRRRVRFLCRADIWDSPVGWAMDAMGHVPVDRTAPAAAYLQARRLLREGEAVCVFPEAGISAAYVVRALMPGAAALSRETGVPLLPVSVWGGARLWPQKRSLDEPLPRPVPSRHRLVDVRVHPPLQVGGAAGGSDPVAVTRRLGAVLQAGLEELQRRPEHRPDAGVPAPWHPAHLGGDALERRASYALDVLPRSAVSPTWGPGPAR